MTTEESEPLTTCDFFVETKGQCFLCLIKVEESNNAKSATGSGSGSRPTSYSIHCLSRYLEMNMIKVFNDKAPIPSQLLEKVLKSNLKVELCEQCACLTERFGVLHQQLENIQKELTSCLNLIQGKLATAEGAALTDRFRRSPWTGKNGKEKLDIAQALRDETMNKCSQKLNKGPSHLSSTTENIKMEKPCEESQLEISQVNLIKVEYPFKDNNDDDDADPDDEMITYLDYTDDLESQQDSRQKPHSKPKSAGWKKQNCDLCHVKVRNLSHHLLTVHFESNPDEEEPPPIVEPQNVLPIEKYLSVAVTTSKSPKVTQKPQYTKDRESGKHKCLACLVDFADYHTVKAHYKNIHLQEKYTCTICKMQFNQRSSYRFHHRSVHMGVKVRCPTCKKYFARQSNLVQHQARAFCKPEEADKPKEYKYSCQHCGRGFSQPGNLRRHLKTIHLKIREYECELCQRKFASKTGLGYHHQAAHVRKMKGVKVQDPQLTKT